MPKASDEPNEVDIQRFFRLARDMVAIADPDGWFLYVNSEWPRTLGWSPTELRSRPFMQFVHPDDLDTTTHESTAIFEDGEDSERFINRYQHKDGSYRWLQWNSRRDEETGNVYAIARDVTSIVQLEEDRQRTLQAIAHDLGSAVTPLSLRIRALRNRAPDVSPADFDKVAKSMAYLTRLVHNVQDVLRLERNELKLQLQQGNLYHLVDTVVNEFDETDGPRPIVEAEPDVEAHFDAHHMNRVLMNLLGNARKFTPPSGTVKVKVWNEGDGARIMVQDTGRGLEAHEQQKLFQPFSQVHEPGSVAERGSGLGLFICKGIVEQHGGRIWVESDGRDRGSTFHVALPRSVG